MAAVHPQLPDHCVNVVNRVFNSQFVKRGQTQEDCFLDALANRANGVIIFNGQMKLCKEGCLRREVMEVLISVVLPQLQSVGLRAYAVRQVPSSQCAKKDRTQAESFTSAAALKGRVVTISNGRMNLYHPRHVQITLAHRSRDAVAVVDEGGGKGRTKEILQRTLEAVLELLLGMMASPPKLTNMV